MTAPRVVELLGPAVGGIRVHVAELTRLLRERGCDVVVAGPAGALGERGEVDAVVDVPSGLDPLALARAARQMGSVPGEVLHAHGLKAGWVAVSARPRRPVVLTLHNLVLREASGRAARLLGALERALIRRVDHVVAPSPAIAEHCRGLVAPDRLSVILPVAPGPRPRRGRDEVREALGITPEQQLVVAVARLHPQKDLGTFLAAMARVAQDRPDARGVIVGDGPQRAELASAIERGGLAGVVRLHGASPHAVDELAAADVVACTSLWEAVPLVVVEAMLLGRPVVSTDVGVVAALVHEGIDGHVTPVGDAEGVAAGIVDLIEREDRAQLGDRARRSAGAAVDPDRLVDELVAVYRQVAPQGWAS
jgi:glycosyltransferase involved in cell wall biosynthesis